VFQCFDRSFNAYLDKCLEIIAFFNDFTVQHVSRIEDTIANNLVQHASSFRSNWGKYGFLEKPDVSVCQSGQPGFWLMCSAIICSTEPSSAKPDGPVFETEGLIISVTSNESSETMMTDPNDWRTPLVCYLENPGHIADWKVWHQALKYVMLENILYRRTINGVLLKFFGSDQSRNDMGKVHEDICGTH
jgi:hypothetical protein